MYTDWCHSFLFSLFICHSVSPYDGRKLPSKYSPCRTNSSSKLQSLGSCQREWKDNSFFEILLYSLRDIRMLFDYAYVLSDSD